MWRVICPYENTFVLSKAQKPKYWKFKDLAKVPKKYQHDLSTEALVIGNTLYAKTFNNERIIKNTKSLGKPKLWVLNGQSLYSGNLHPLIRAKIRDHYHKLFRDCIKDSKLAVIDIPQGLALKVSVDIYELNKGHLPDALNLWPLIKWFEDSLVELGVIPDDSPKYVRSSGENTYIWVENEDQRKLVFKIDVI